MADFCLNCWNQMQYAFVIIAVSAVTYLLAGFVHEWYIVLPIGLILTVVTLLAIRAVTAKKQNA